MICAVDQGCLHAEHREASKRTRTHDAFDTLLNAWDVFLRNSTTNDLGFEDEVIAFMRFENDLDASKLTRTTRLLLMGVIDFSLTCDRFTVSNLRRADVCFYLELTLHAVDENVEMKFTHASDDSLTRFFIRLNAERRIFSSQTVERDAHLFLVSLGLWFNRDFDNRIREFHAFKDNRLQRIAERIASCGFLEASQSNDVASIGFFDVFTAVRVHLQHAADALTLALNSVFERNALGHLARVDTSKGKRTNERIVHDLECKHR